MNRGGCGCGDDNDDNADDDDNVGGNDRNYPHFL